MTVTDVRKDPEARTMTITTRFDAPAERVWRLWSDPRRLERWWGPPGYPATFGEHDLRPGGRVSFRMPGPDGEPMAGSWRVHVVEPPHRLDFDLASEGLPTLAMHVTIDEDPDGGTRMVIETAFPSDAAMDHMITIGFEQGMSAAIGQIDGVLAASPSALGW